MVLVLGLIVSFSIIGAVNLSSLQTIFKLRSVADEVKSLLRHGRELAIANKDDGGYKIIFSDNSFKLLSQNNEFTRYQIPTKVTVDPISFSWEYSTISGEIAGCSPCQITLTSKSLTESITIQENGIIN